MNLSYIPIFPVILIALTPDGPARRFIPRLCQYPIIYILRGGYYNMHMFLYSTCNKYTMRYWHNLGINPLQAHLGLEQLKSPGI